MADTARTELDPGTQENILRARLRDLEAQHLQVEVRVNAPAQGEPEGGTEDDKRNLAQLEKSIEWVRSQLPQETIK